MTITLLLYNFKLNILIFSTSLNSSLIIFILTIAVNYRNALDRLHVRMNIILLVSRNHYNVILLTQEYTYSKKKQRTSENVKNYAVHKYA